MTQTEPEVNVLEAETVAEVPLPTTVKPVPVTDQMYETAPETAPTVYELLVDPGQMYCDPDIEPGIEGIELIVKQRLGPAKPHDVRPETQS